MSNFIDQSFMMLYDWGFFTIILPFILIYVIAYGILVKTKVLARKGDESYKKYSALVAFVLAFMFVSMVDITNKLPQFISSIVLLFIGIIIFQIVIGITGVSNLLDTDNKKNIFTWLTAIVLILISINIFLGKDTITNLANELNLKIYGGAILVLALLSLFIFWIMKDPKTKSATTSKKTNYSSPKKTVSQKIHSEEDFTNKLNSMKENKKHKQIPSDEKKVETIDHGYFNEDSFGDEDFSRLGL